MITSDSRLLLSIRAVCIAAAFCLSVSMPLSAREPKPNPSVSDSYDQLVDLARLNAFLKEKCYFESVTPDAPKGLALKRRCLGKVDDTGTFTLRIDTGYGLPDSKNGLVVLNWREDWKIGWHDLQVPWAILEDSPPGNGGIVLFCRKTIGRACASGTITAYSEDGKRIISQTQIELQAHDDKRTGASIGPIPVNVPMSQIVEEFLRPFERLITTDHTDLGTCFNHKCAP